MTPRLLHHRRCPLRHWAPSASTAGCTCPKGYPIGAVRPLRTATPRAPAPTSRVHGFVNRMYALKPAPPTDSTDKGLALLYWRAVWFWLGEPNHYERWSRSERALLLRLEARWRRRALGQDARWQLTGTTKGGRLSRELERIVRPPAKPKRRDRAGDWIGKAD